MFLTPRAGFPRSSRRRRARLSSLTPQIRGEELAQGPDPGAPRPAHCRPRPSVLSVPGPVTADTPKGVPRWLCILGRPWVSLQTLAVLKPQGRLLFLSFRVSLLGVCLLVSVSLVFLSWLSLSHSFIPSFIPPRNSHSALPRGSTVFKSTGPGQGSHSN